jgi:hypothetical protein
MTNTWMIISGESGRFSTKGYRKRLRSMSDSEVRGFALALAQLQTSLDRESIWFAGMLLNGGSLSDDGFFHFRSWVLSKGQAVYEMAMACADSLESVRPVVESDGYPVAECEALFEILWDELYDRFDPEDSFLNSLSEVYESVSDYPDELNPELVQKKLPKLWSKYGDLCIKWSAKAKEDDLSWANRSHKDVGLCIVHEEFGNGIVIGVDPTYDGGLLVQFGTKQEWVHRADCVDAGS